MSSLVKCHVRKPFAYSLDGVNQRKAISGSVGIPADLMHGLEREGYVSRIEAKGVSHAPENKAVASAPENKRIVSKGPRGLWFAYQNGKRVSKGYATETDARGSIGNDRS